MAATWGRGTKPLRLAAIGWGRFGRACAAALHETPDLMWAGVVRRDPPLGVTLGEGMAGAPMASHPRDLEAVDAVPVCIPTEAVPGTVQELLQMRLPVVECAGIDGRSQGDHHERAAQLAKRNRVGAVLGASWNPGAAAAATAVRAADR